MSSTRNGVFFELHEFQEFIEVLDIIILAIIFQLRGRRVYLTAIIIPVFLFMHVSFVEVICERGGPSTI